MAEKIRTYSTHLGFREQVTTVYELNSNSVPGGEVIGKDNLYLHIRVPVNYVDFCTSRDRKGFLDGVFRTDELGEWKEAVEIYSLNNMVIEGLENLYMPKTYKTDKQGLRHHEEVLEGILKKFERYGPRVIQKEVYPMEGKPIITKY